MAIGHAVYMAPRYEIHERERERVGVFASIRMPRGEFFPMRVIKYMCLARRSPLYPPYMTLEVIQHDRLNSVGLLIASGVTAA